SLSLSLSFPIQNSSVGRARGTTVPSPRHGEEIRRRHPAPSTRRDGARRRAQPCVGPLRHHRGGCEAGAPGLHRGRIGGGGPGECRLEWEDPGELRLPDLRGEAPGKLRQPDPPEQRRRPSSGDDERSITPADASTARCDVRSGDGGQQ
ncbi:unnamed protein product, partial [Urochloa humidicola]